MASIRRLAAILADAAAGRSRLMGVDEERAPSEGFIALRGAVDDMG